MTNNQLPRSLGMQTYTTENITFPAITGGSERLNKTSFSRAYFRWTDDGLDVVVLSQRNIV